MASTQHPLDRLDVSPRILKRAQYEALVFAIRPPYVEVRNHSHPDPENHTYSVRIADGFPVTCSCPADTEYERACKHRVGVAIRRVILDMAIEAEVAADGGAVEGQHECSSTQTDDVKADCECHPDNRLPCWPCVKAGRRELPESDDDAVDDA